MGHRTYSDDFKAITLHLAGKVGCSKAARMKHISRNNIYSWKNSGKYNHLDEGALLQDHYIEAEEEKIEKELQTK